MPRSRRAFRAVLAAATITAITTLAACSDDDSVTAPTEVTLEEALDELNTVGTYTGAGVATVGMPVAGPHHA